MYFCETTEAQKEAAGALGCSVHDLKELFN